VFRRDPDLVLDAPGLNIADTPEAVASSLANGEPTRALAIAIGLEGTVVPLVLRCIAYEHVSLVCSALPLPFVGRLLGAIAALINSDKKELHLCLLWARHLLGAHGKIILQEYGRFREPVLALQRALHRKTQSIASVCASNSAMMRFLIESPAPLAANGGTAGTEEVELMEEKDEELEDNKEELEGWGDEWAGQNDVMEEEQPRPAKKSKKKKKTKKQA
jgi:hypothetical protein